MCIWRRRIKNQNRLNAMDNAVVSFNSKKCKACWLCLEKCPSKIIKKVDFLWHKHALIKDKEKCIGCFACVKACKYGAFIKKS